MHTYSAHDKQAANTRLQQWAPPCVKHAGQRSATGAQQTHTDTTRTHTHTSMSKANTSHEIPRRWRSHLAWPRWHAHYLAERHLCVWWLPHALSSAVLCVCSVCVLCVFCVCSVCVLCVFCVCSVCVLCVRCVCSVCAACALFTRIRELSRAPSCVWSLSAVCVWSLCYALHCLSKLPMCLCSSDCVLSLCPSLGWVRERSPTAHLSSCKALSAVCPPQ